MELEQDLVGGILTPFELENVYTIMRTILKFRTDLRIYRFINMHHQLQKEFDEDVLEEFFDTMITLPEIPEHQIVKECVYLYEAFKPLANTNHIDGYNLFVNELNNLTYIVFIKIACKFRFNN